MDAKQSASAEVVKNGEVLKERFELLDMDLIQHDPNQPRQRFVEDTIKELADSIKEDGLLQPIIVKPSAAHDKDGAYVIVAGERRYRAFQILKRRKIPAVIREGGDTFALSLVENILREDLNPIDEAAGIKTLIHKKGYSQEQVAELVKKSRAWVAQRLLLLRLPKEVQMLVSEGKLPAVQALNLARYKGAKGRIIGLAHDLSAARLSSEQALRAIRSSLKVSKDFSDEDLLLGIDDLKTEGMNEDERALATEQRSQTIKTFDVLYKYLRNIRNSLARLDKIPEAEKDDYFKAIPERTRSKIVLCALEVARDLSVIFEIAKRTSTDAYAATQYEGLVKKLQTEGLADTGKAGQMRTVPEWLLAPWAMLLHHNGPTRSIKELISRTGITATSLPGFMNGALTVISEAWDGKEGDSPEAVEFCARVQERFQGQKDLAEIIKSVPGADDPLEIEMIL
jgi:ParB family chromosome partitioning protein